MVSKQKQMGENILSFNQIKETDGHWDIMFLVGIELRQSVLFFLYFSFFELIGFVPNTLRVGQSLSSLVYLDGFKACTILSFKWVIHGRGYTYRLEGTDRQD